MDIEPIPAQPKQRKAYKSRKPASVQQAIITKASLGDTNSQIARDLGIHRNTVSSLLSASDIQQHVDEIRSDIVLKQDLWLARKVMRRKLRKGSESAATTMLRGFNVLQSGSQMQVNVQNNGAQTWIQIVEAKRNEVVLPNSSAIGSTNDLQRDSQPVDNEPVKP